MMEAPTTIKYSNFWRLPTLKVQLVSPNPDQALRPPALNLLNRQAPPNAVLIISLASARSFASPSAISDRTANSSPDGTMTQVERSSPASPVIGPGRIASCSSGCNSLGEAEEIGVELGPLLRGEVVGPRSVSFGSGFISR